MCIGQDYFDRHVVDVARELLGKQLIFESEEC